jgi:hypothetical protein
MIWLFHVTAIILLIQEIMKIKFKQWWSTIPPISTTQSPLTSIHWTKKYHDMTLKIQVLAWDRHYNVAGLNHVWLLGTFANEKGQRVFLVIYLMKNSNILKSNSSMSCHSSSSSDSRRYNIIIVIKFVGDLWKVSDFFR